MNEQVVLLDVLFISLSVFNHVNDFLSQDNAIYNLLPDIISRLSDPERGMKEEDFSTIMKQVNFHLVFG